MKDIKMLFVHDLRKLLLQNKEGIGIVSNGKKIEYRRINDEIFLAIRKIMETSLQEQTMIDLLKAIGFQEVRNNEKAIWMKIHHGELEQVSVPVIRERCVELGYDMEV